MKSIEPEVENTKSIYDLELNELLPANMKWGIRYDIIRVPGGWIYQPIRRNSNGNDEYFQSCFVPYNNEFI